MEKGDTVKITLLNSSMSIYVVEIREISESGISGKFKVIWLGEEDEEWGECDGLFFWSQITKLEVVNKVI
jgi:hypothetical protein